MTPREIKEYYNKKPVIYIPKSKERLLLEDNVYIPRFKLKSVDSILDVPINEPIKPTEELFIKAIKNGFIIVLEYKGEKDKLFSGHTRTISPLVIGKSSKGKLLIRGYHLTGFSVSSNKHINKIWRMFRFDRILSVTFTGSFIRLAPDGYMMHDKGMRGGILAAADFNEIRKNQQALVKANQIQNKAEVSLGTEDENGFTQIKVKDTKSKLDLNNVLDNETIKNLKDDKNLKVTLLRSVYGSKYVAILGALGEPGKTVKVSNERNVNQGVYKVLDTILGGNIKKIKNVRGQSVYDLYIFDKKL